MRVLHHHSEKPLGELYNQPTQQVGWKPTGLWVSDESSEVSWSSWCRGEEFQQECFAYQYAISIEPTSRVLWIETADELLRFHNRFSTLDPRITSYKKHRN
jgi:hypothetical protein